MIVITIFITITTIIIERNQLLDSRLWTSLPLELRACQMSNNA